MTRQASAAMTAATQQALQGLLVRADGQEDLCLATYRLSTGAARRSALIASAIAPEPGDRRVHGNVTVTADYILRGLDIARKTDCGLVLLHSHPGACRWQPMSGPDRDAEASYANLAREVTGLPLVGMTPRYRRQHLVGAPLGYRGRQTSRLHPRHQCEGNRPPARRLLERRPRPPAAANLTTGSHRERLGRPMPGRPRPAPSPSRRRGQRRPRHHRAARRLRPLLAHRHGLRHRRRPQPRPAHRSDPPRRPPVETQDPCRPPTGRRRRNPPPAPESKSPTCPYANPTGSNSPWTTISSSAA